MWTEKYRPTCLDEYYGNNENVKITVNWVNSVLNGSPISEGLLYHGPPGTGKTTLALLIEEIYDLPTDYYNASDARKKRDVQKMITGGITTSLGKKTKILILDEAEGIRSNLTKLIKNTHPILICNDMYDVSKDTRKLLFDLEFNLPSEDEKKRYAEMICEREDLDMGVRPVIEDSKSLRSVAKNLQLAQYGYDDFAEEQHQYGLFEEVRRHFEGEEVWDADVKPRELLVWALDNGGSPGLVSKLDGILGKTPPNDYRGWKYVYGLIGSTGARGSEYPRQWKLMSKYKSR